MSHIYVSHLECSETGQRYEAGRVHGLSEAGKPLLVRYHLEALKAGAGAGTASAGSTGGDEAAEGEADAAEGGSDSPVAGD